MFYLTTIVLILLGMAITVLLYSILVIGGRADDLMENSFSHRSHGESGEHSGGDHS
jgi:hypothetical protein